MIAQRKLQEDAADTQASHKVEEEELKRKTAIKEKERATREKEDD